jgi:hypothetical protein
MQRTGGTGGRGMSTVDRRAGSFWSPKKGKAFSAQYARAYARGGATTGYDLAKAIDSQNFVGGLGGRIAP